MFPTRSLLLHADCPDFRDDGCHRPSCPYSHNPQSKQRQTDHGVQDDGAEQESSGPSGRKRKASPGGMESKATPGKKAANADLTRLLSALGNGPRNAHAARKQEQEQQPQRTIDTTAAGAPTAAVSPQASTSAALPSATSQLKTKAPTMPVANTQGSSSSTLLTAPLIPRSSHPGASPVPYTSRQSSLRTLFSAYHTLYSSLLHLKPASTSTGSERRALELLKRLVHHYASQDAQTSETKIFKNSNVNFLAYRNSIRTSLVGVSRRQKTDKEAEGMGKDDCISTVGILAIESACQTEKNPIGAKVENKEGDEAMEKAIVKVLDESSLIGTSEEVERKRKETEERRHGTLTRERVESAQLLTDQETLLKVGYPCPDLEKSSEHLQTSIDECWGEGGREHDLEGSTVKCERCSAPFKVMPLEPDSEEREACSFHWGKRRFVREANVAKGPRLPRWTCCDALDEATTFASNSLSQIASSAGLVESSNGQACPPSGCSRGPHVFKEEGTELLHKREGFLSTETVCSGLSVVETACKKYDVLAFDCELVYTTAGMSLARLTVLDEAGQVTLDQYVKPRAAILDYNTRYSGIKESDLAAGKEVVDLDKARKKMVAMMEPQTILVGHGLENDLKAIRLVHLQVADSALIYRHHKGLPFRFGLRDLTLKHLGKHIQGGDATHGHDAEEDARAALDLVRLKYRDHASNGASQRNDAPTAQPSNAKVAATPPGPVASTGSTKTSSVAARPSGPSAAATASLFMKKREPVRRKTK